MLARLLQFWISVSAKFAIHAVLLVALVWGTAHASTPAIEAVPLKGINVDGDLSDWPEDMKKHLVGLSASEFYQRTDIYSADLSTSADLSPHFRIGYDADENLLYLGIEVRDDDLVVSSSYSRSDGCEVYVSNGSNRPKQYVQVPSMAGHGWGDRRPTRTRQAYSRKGDVTVYEWAIEVFDRVPDNPARLAAGQTIGFDVVIVDKDDNKQAAAWIPWGSLAPSKVAGSDRVGRVVLAGGDPLMAGSAWAWPSFGGGLTNFIGIGILVLCLGFAGYLIRRAAPTADGVELNGLSGRLEAIERRLTDTQDVMIALSEKYDRLEEKYQNLEKSGEEA